MTTTRYERDYLERAIETVRNHSGTWFRTWHRGADNYWLQWANIFADEIVRLWQVEEAARNTRAVLANLRDTVDLYISGDVGMPELADAMDAAFAVLWLDSLEVA